MNVKYESKTCPPDPLFSFTDNEPLRPMYLALSRVTDKETDKDPYLCAIEAYPVPGTGQIKVRFVLPENVMGAAVSLTSQNGLFAKSYKLGSLNAGQQRLTISTNLNNGIYIVNVKADKYHGHSVTTQHPIVHERTSGSR